VILRMVQNDSFCKVLTRFASAQTVSTFLRLISGLLVVRLIEPEIYGQYTGVGVFLGYLLLGQGGLINGLSRELPFELGRKNDE
jgi:O-antigen/teichoic acid export membrane protein